MNITVIGRGNVGGGLAGLWERAGHQVTRLGRGRGNVGTADAVLLAVPGTAVEMALSSVVGLEGKTVLDAGYEAVRLGDLSMAATQEGLAGPMFAIAQSGLGQFVYRLASPEQL
ncbi:NAD(P)-binding domain-containing protein [Nonomuraea angiospora]|uniref:hypothetical protein n=1 Tax=Nonomuraea angiospora TaxID=46172 RepID=UPI0029B2D614|nr:hypothetical protein [Nonomuraea angiospora]MDX3101861.1 hypothetical protein [Nonomuraea angiospora]